MSSACYIDRNSPVLKIAVFANGDLTVDGAPASIRTLKDSLRQLAGKKGIVWYYREAATLDPPAIGPEVTAAIIKEHLPVRLSSLPDYSDAIGPDGLPISQ